PQIDWGGAGPGYVEMEFPIIPFLTAIFYKMFGVHDVLALVIPFLGGIGVVVAVYALARRLHDAAVALVAGLFAGISPLLSLASQTFLSEPPLILCTVLSIYFLVRWVETRRVSDYVLSLLCTTLAVLLKLTALYVGLPLLFVFMLKYGKKAFSSGYFWLFGILSLLPVVLWYYHAHTLYLEYGNTFGILSGGYNKFARAELLFGADFYILMAKRILLSVSTPVVFLLFLYGMFQRPSKRIAFVLHVWVIALVIYTLLIAEGNKDMIYYQLPWLPVLAISGGAGFFSLLRRLEHLSVTQSHTRQRIALAVVCGAVFLSAVGVAARAIRVPIDVVENEARIRSHAQEVMKAAPDGSLIIVASSYGNEKTPETIDTPPQMFYFSGRHGWYIALAWVTPGMIDSLKQKGAGYFVVCDADVEGLRANAMLYSHLTSTYPALIDRNDLVVFSLARK
ncbi:MAG: 2 protein, partial [Bacteroidetes bacterium]|nr:2 protein [Bacteroidota bacterium]